MGTSAFFSAASLRELVAGALDEDLGRGDITSTACIAAEIRGSADFMSREALVLCGLPLAKEVFLQVDPELRFEVFAYEGERCEANTKIASVSGAARSILMGERVALNFLQRLSGVATLTRRFVDAARSGGRAKITDTRKTTPGLRAFERYAVRCGGGINHRYDLSSAVLIKDNHIAAAGGLKAAVEGARRFASHTMKIECEVDHLDQLEEALACGVDIVLLDNFDDAQLAEAVRINAGRALLEASGGVQLARVASIAATGVDVISVGALTHSAPAVDIGLDWSASAP